VTYIYIIKTSKRDDLATVLFQPPPSHSLFIHSAFLLAVRFCLLPSDPSSAYLTWSYGLQFPSYSTFFFRIFLCLWLDCYVSVSSRRRPQRDDACVQALQQSSTKKKQCQVGPFGFASLICSIMFLSTLIQPKHVSMNCCLEHYCLHVACLPACPLTMIA
jgi:hypothetical protein